MKTTAEIRSPLFKWLSFVHLAIASAMLIRMLLDYGASFQAPYLIFSGLLLAFIIAQAAALRLFTRTGRIQEATWILVWALLAGVLSMPLLIRHAPLLCGYYLTAVPLFFAATNQLKALPAILFLTLVAAATTILLDLVLPFERALLVNGFRQVQTLTAIGLGVYVGVMGGLLYFQHKRGRAQELFKINVATQYALVITGISTMVIILVTGVLTSQIRRAQIDQVGKNFQTLSENLAKLVGSNLEQQSQKLQLLSEQLPVFKEGLIKANAQYSGERTAARQLLEQKNRRWQASEQASDFVMDYLNNPLNLALSRFRGHNSFHKDLVVVDAYGGLVASLGKKPKKFYFFDEKWWQTTWNGGLGNIFIGDPVNDRPDRLPMLRIAVDIIDHTTNAVIGMLSSQYLMGTLLDDIARFKPDFVDQISLVDVSGKVIASTQPELVNRPVWSQLSSTLIEKLHPDAGWVLGRDHHDQSALIGYSSLSTVYNVIGDPLHRLHWHIVVSGTRSSALHGVTQSTKLAMLLGLVAMALGVLAAIAASRVITQPIENLTATASSMIEGDLDNRASLTGPEELVALSTGFNRLTDRLRNVIHNLQSQTKQLAKAKREAETATQLKGQFLANMSHEIRTPLNAILGFADLLEASITDQQLKRRAQIIRSSGADLLQLINDILDLSKIEAGRMEIQRQAVDLRGLFDELAGIFSMTAEEKNLRFEIQVAEEVPHQLMLDRTRLRQILFNLLGNALKFTARGEVGCRASTAAGKRSKHWDLTIEVHDTGIGIDPSAYQAIFETFNQNHAQVPSMIEGTGLGLSISKNLVEMMDGEIRVYSNKTKGTCFTIKLPDVIAAEAESEAPEADQLTTQPTRATRIQFQPAALLVVDDLAVNRQLIRETLKASPLDLEEAQNGQEAVAKACMRAYDLILMDIRMPDMNGFEALKKIRRQGGGAEVPVIALTASGMKEDVIRIQEAGFDDLLIRPFDQVALLELLACYLPRADSDKGAFESEGESLASDVVLEQLPLWTCPPAARDRLFNTLRHQWRQAQKKQSVPEIVAFAKAVAAIGDQYDISIISRYGSELAGYADAFDIHQMEKLLANYEKVLDRWIAPAP